MTVLNISKFVDINIFNYWIKFFLVNNVNFSHLIYEYRYFSFI